MGKDKVYKCVSCNKRAMNRIDKGLDAYKCGKCGVIFHEQYIIGFWKGYKQKKDQDELDNIVGDFIKEVHNDFVDNHKETDRLLKESIEDDKKFGRGKYSKKE